jgi:hypothetical protein
MLAGFLLAGPLLLTNFRSGAAGDQTRGAPAKKHPGDRRFGAPAPQSDTRNARAEPADRDFAALLRDDSCAAARLAARLPQTITREVLGRCLREPELAQRLMTAILESWPDEPTGERRELYRRCRLLWIQMDAPGYIRWEVQHPAGSSSPAPLSDRAGAFTDAILGSPDPAVTATEVLPLLSAAERTETMEQLVSAWAAIDPDAAGAWLDRQPDNSERWPAIAAFAAACTRLDSASALAWAQTIGDPALRDRTAAKLLATWHSTDPRAANAWLDSSALPPEAIGEWRDRLAIVPPEDP